MIEKHIGRICDDGTNVSKEKVRVANAELRGELVRRGFSNDELSGDGENLNDACEAHTALRETLEISDRLDRFFNTKTSGTATAQTQKESGMRNVVKEPVGQVERAAYRDGLMAQAQSLHRKLSATIGCTEPVPTASNDTERDI